MGDCLTTAKSEELPLQDNLKQQERTKPNITLSTCPTFEKTHTVTSIDPNIKIKAPPLHHKPPPRQPSIDLRESASNHSRSRSRSCSRSSCDSKSSRSHSGSKERNVSGDRFLASRLGSQSIGNDPNNVNLGIGYSNSFMMRKSEDEDRRSSNVPVQIIPTISYFVNAEGQLKSRPQGDVEFFLQNGEILISKVETVSRAPPRPNVEQSAVVVMTRQDNRAAPQLRPIVQQSAVLVNTKMMMPQETAYPRPNIYQSSVMIQTRPNNH